MRTEIYDTSAYVMAAVEEPIDWMCRPDLDDPAYRDWLLERTFGNRAARIAQEARDKGMGKGTGKDTSKGKGQGKVKGKDDGKGKVKGKDDGKDKGKS